MRDFELLNFSISRENLNLALIRWKNVGFGCSKLYKVICECPFISIEKERKREKMARQFCQIEKRTRE